MAKDAEVVPTDLPTGGEGDGDKKNDKPAPEPTVPLSKLYQFASPAERVILVVSAFASLASGLAQPMMLLAFKSMFSSMGAGIGLPGAKIDQDVIDRVMFIMLFIGVGMFFGQLIGNSGVEYVVASLTLKYKRAYLKAVLRQDVRRGCARPARARTAVSDRRRTAVASACAGRLVRRLQPRGALERLRRGDGQGEERAQRAGAHRHGPRLRPRRGRDGLLA
jgi:hypothetical protein